MPRRGWDSRRQCRLGPNSERVRAHQHQCGRRGRSHSLLPRHRPKGRCVGTRRLRHEDRVRDGSGKCAKEQPSLQVRMDPDTKIPGEREAFIERAKKRVARIDEERQAEVRSFEEAENKLNQLRALRIPQQDQPISLVPDSSAEVQRLQAIVSQLQRQFEQSSHRCQSSPTKVGEKIFVPNSVEEMQQWMFDRQQDLQEATMAVRPGE